MKNTDMEIGIIRQGQGKKGRSEGDVNSGNQEGRKGIIIQGRPVNSPRIQSPLIRSRYLQGSQLIEGPLLFGGTR